MAAPPAGVPQEEPSHVGAAPGDAVTESPAGGKCQKCRKWVSQERASKGGGCLSHPDAPTRSEEGEQFRVTVSVTYPCCGQSYSYKKFMKRRIVPSPGCVEGDHEVPGVSTGRLTKRAVAE